jgi:hypothetical protein
MIPVHIVAVEFIYFVCFLSVQRGFYDLTRYPLAMIHSLVLRRIWAQYVMWVCGSPSHLLRSNNESCGVSIDADSNIQHFTVLSFSDTCFRVWLTICITYRYTVVLYAASSANR